MRIWVFVLVLLALLTGGGGWYWHNAGKSSYEYHTALVRHGDLVSSIAANGTIEPEEVVDIGAQVAGQIISFGTDADGKTIDYRSQVEPDMVLAKIDDLVYQAAFKVAEAQVAQAETLITKGKADLQQANAKLLEAQHNWDRARTLGPSDALSQNDYDMYQADYETAKANVAVAESEIAQATSGVQLTQAQLDAAQRNLAFCTIKTPPTLKGVILDRRVNIGQTVVSSLNTPSLFLIAKDLSHMQIWVSVNEADVGKIVPGAPVTFTCDTFPGKIFDGKVGKVRWNPTMTQNVVLYTVEVQVDNPKGVLIPYLTAMVQFEVARANDSLIVPNLALRWTPETPQQVSPDVRDAWQKSQADARKPHEGIVWIKDGRFVRPVDVKSGVTDRVDTAVTSDALKENTEVVIGDVDLSVDTGPRNPFIPPARKRGH